MLTRRQKKMLRIVERFIEEHGYSPTYEEIGRTSGTAVGSVHDIMKRIQQKGYITVEKRKERTICIIKEYD